MAELPSQLVDGVRSSLPAWHMDVVRLLPVIPLQLRTTISDQGFIMPHTGVGGRAISANHIHIGLQPDFDGGIDQQVRNVRPVYFHESYHVAQKRHAEKRGESDDDPSAIKAAILEGSATRFESLRASSTPPWANYEDEETMVGLTKQMQALPSDYDRVKWMYRDSEAQRLWTGYKVGTFIVDKVLQANEELAIEDLVTFSVEDILDLSQIDPS